MEEIIHILTASPVLENDYNDLANEALQRTKTKYEEKLRLLIKSYEEKLQNEWAKHEIIMKEMKEEALRNLYVKPKRIKEITLEEITLSERQEIDIGGTIFVTSLTAMRYIKGSLFYKAFSDPVKVVTEGVFFDRDPTYFFYILEYLRLGLDERGHALPKDNAVREYLVKEGRFYRLERLVIDLLKNAQHTWLCQNTGYYPV